MAKPKSSRPIRIDADPEYEDIPSVRQQALHEAWDRDSEETLDESKLRGEPEWLEAIGDEDESEGVIEANLQEYGFELRGEDDYVSDPTSPADSPTWVADEYDDEEQDDLDSLEDQIAADDNNRDEDEFPR